MRLGLRSGKNATLDTNKGCFIFVMSSDKYPLMRIIKETGAVIDNINEILKEIKCDEKTASMKFIGNHKKTISSNLEIICDQYERSYNERNNKTNVKKYFSNRLEQMHTLWGMEDKILLHKIDRLKTIISDLQGHRYLKNLESIKTRNLKDQELIDDLENLFEDYEIEVN